MSPTVEVFIIVLLILANAVFVMSEMAIVSARKVRLQFLANQGNSKARTALELANSPNQFLATVQIGITSIAILSGAFGESALSKIFTPIFASIPALEDYSALIASISSILIVTFLTLTIGELLPKQVALNTPERIATAVAIPMRLLSRITAPFVQLLAATTGLIVKLMGIQPSTEPEVTEEEIKVLIEQGTEAGTFEEAEQDMVERVFRLGDRRIGALMTPRPDIVWLDLEDSAEVNRQKMMDSRHSRFPVCQGELDNVLGVVNVSDLLARSLNSQPLDLTISLRQPLFIPESTRGLKVLELFKQTSTHVALVVDEYGVIQGLVTLNDMLVEIVGDIPSVDEQEHPQAVQREDGSWLLDGMLSIEEFFELFNLEDPGGEYRGNYHTLGGFVIMHLGKIPAAADYFEWDIFRFEVMDMDGNRVDKVLIVPLSGNRESRASNEEF
jgi:putative hemolysin